MKRFALATGLLCIGVSGVTVYAGTGVGPGPLPATGSGTRASYVHAWRPYHERDASGTNSYCVSDHAGTPLPPFISQAP